MHRQWGIRQCSHWSRCSHDRCLPLWRDWANMEVSSVSLSLSLLTLCILDCYAQLLKAWGRAPCISRANEVPVSAYHCQRLSSLLTLTPPPSQGARVCPDPLQPSRVSPNQNGIGGQDICDKKETMWRWVMWPGSLDNTSCHLTNVLAWDCFLLLITKQTQFHSHNGWVCNPGHNWFNGSMPSSPRPQYITCPVRRDFWRKRESEKEKMRFKIWGRRKY